jgi:hypothetical protein
LLSWYTVFLILNAIRLLIRKSGQTVKLLRPILHLVQELFYGSIVHAFCNRGIVFMITRAIPNFYCRKKRNDKQFSTNYKVDHYHVSQFTTRTREYRTIIIVRERNTNGARVQRTCWLNKQISARRRNDTLVMGIISTIVFR